MFYFLFSQIRDKGKQKLTFKLKPKSALQALYLDINIILQYFFCSFVSNLMTRGVFSAQLKRNMFCNLSKLRYFINLHVLNRISVWCILLIKY